MGQAGESIPQVSQLTELKQTKELEKYSNQFWHLSLQDTPVRTFDFEKALSRMASRFSLKKTANHRISKCELADHSIIKDQSGWDFKVQPLCTKTMQPVRL